MASILVLYGSETGNAQDVAETLWRDARRRQIPCRLMPLDEYEIENLPFENSTTLFVIATSGQGEIPTNARSNWRRLLAKRLPLNSHLSGVRVAVFGLGDSSYQQSYNYAAKKFSRRLAQLGAEAVVEMGLGDDQHPLGIDGGFEPWRRGLWAALRTKESQVDDDALLPPKYRLVCSEEDKIHPASHSKEEEYCQVRVLSNERVTHSEHFQCVTVKDTRLITFANDDSRQPIVYRPGDVLMVQPKALEESVHTAVEALGLKDEEMDAPFWLEASDESIPLPPSWILSQPVTFRHCLHSLFDLQAIPKRSLLHQLAQLTPTTTEEGRMERERLLELSSPAGIDDYLDYCQRPRRTVAELLRDFPSTTAAIPRERLFDLLPTMRARAFSIASSPVAHKGVIQLLVARVEYRAKRMAIPRLGLCSNYLARLNEGDKVFVRVRPGTFRLNYAVPSLPSPSLQLVGYTNLMLVGPGTGVAPFRSIITTANFCGERNDGLPCPMVLFFGCRGRQRDFYFEKDWGRFDGARLQLVCAFSRDQEQRVYVQQRIVERAGEVWAVLRDEKALVLVAGSAGDMPKGVLSALRQVAREEGGVDDAEVYIDELQRRGRIQFETWS